MSKNVRIASAVWGASILLSRLVSMVREGAIGRILGASAASDVYNASFQLPDFLNYLLAAGALSIVFIPIFAGHLARGDEARGWDAFSAIATFLAVLLLALTAVLFALAPALARWIAPGFSPAQLEDLVRLTRIVLPAQVFHVLGGLLSAALQARDRHALPALAPIVYTGGIVAGGLLGGSSLGPYGFAWGALAGSFLGPFLLPLIGCLRTGMRWRLTWAPRHPDLRTYLARSLPIMLGFSIVVVDDWYLRHHGSLIGTGTLTILNDAKTLMRVPMGVFGLAAGMAAFPTLSRLVAQGRGKEMRAALVATTRKVLVLALAAQVVLTVSGTEIATLVYGQRRMTPDQLREIGACLAWISIGLAAWSAQPLLSRGFYAMGNTWLPALLGTGVAVVALPIYALGREQFGARGLAAASSAAILAYTFALAVMLGRATKAHADDRWAEWLARAAAALALGVATGWSLQAILPLPGSTLPILALRTILHGGTAALVLLAGARLLGIREASILRLRERTA
ncbi:MAG TPA: murein biosynthesis integral membrane protein MurJ [Planctomycetota bacterium]|nr:murein biosynthesis integral membrane protein MurJ [Planctomycetota bacterium]